MQLVADSTQDGKAEKPLEVFSAPTLPSLHRDMLNHDCSLNCEALDAATLTKSVLHAISGFFDAEEAQDLGGRASCAWFVSAVKASRPDHWVFADVMEKSNYILQYHESKDNTA